MTLRRLALLLLIPAIDKSTRLANQKLLTLRARDRHVRLVNADMRFTAARMKRPAARLAHQRLFAKTAFHHGCDFRWYRKIEPFRLALPKKRCLELSNPINAGVF